MRFSRKNAIDVIWSFMNHYYEVIDTFKLWNESRNFQLNSSQHRFLMKITISNYL